MPTLNWLTKEDDIKQAQKTPYKLLEEVSKYSFGDKNTGNMLIQGDNLEALKALLPFYAGQIKTVFIDPPYNTRAAFEHYDDNLEHTEWLAMMYPRLELIRDLLKEDGSVWITIDDNEAHYLKVILDEIFGRKSFIANVIWRSTDNSNNDAKQFSTDHNHIIIYSKQENWQPNKILDVELKRSHFKNPDNDPRGPWFDGNPLNSPKPRPNLTFNLTAPNGNTIKPPKNGWRWSKETMAEKIASGEIKFTANGKSIRRRTYLADMKALPPSTLWADLEETGHNRQAKYEIKNLFKDELSEELFGTPKPERLLKKIIDLSTKEGDFILDSFLGSGTTAAVAHKMGRKYIGIEMGEHALTYCVPRLKKVINGEQGGISSIVNWQKGGGFRFFKLGSEVFDTDGHIKKDINFHQLAAHIWFSETNTPYDVKNEKDPVLGIYEDNAYALLYNGVLGDKNPAGGNVLTQKTLDIILSKLKKKEYKKIVIYGEYSRLGDDRLKAKDIVFNQTPYDVKAR